MDRKSRDLVMGKLYFKNKDYNMAENCLIEYLNSSPDDFQALKLLAQVYENMRNIPKAFELYVKCSLTHPERKGVLLDICRLLLMKDPSLDLSHVDQKKWLRSAIQAFPSNPIVVSLRQSLPTTDHKPSRSKTTDPAVVDRISAIQKQIEQHYESLQNRFQQFEKSLESTIERIVEKSLNGLQKRVETRLDKLSETMDRRLQAMEKYQEKQIGPLCEQLKSTSIDLSKKKDSPAPVSSTIFGRQTTPVTFLPSSVATTPQTVAPPAEPEVASPATPQTASPATSVAQPLASVGLPPPLSNGLLFNSSPFSFTQTDSSSSNLFASSLAKFNIPTEGNWGAQQPVEKTESNDNSAKTSDFSFFKKDPQSVSDEKPKNDNSANKFMFNFSPKKEEAAGSDEDGDDDDHVKEVELPIENTCDMQPIQVQTGEENEDTVFEQRCKLHRFKDKEYKERGIGNMKVLRHKETGKGRLIMRRELVNLVCLNCWSLSKIERVRDVQVRFAGIDASDGEPEMTVFLAKFKTQELTDSFINHLTNLFPEESSG